MRKRKLAFAALLAAVVATAVLLAVGATAGSASSHSAKAAFKVAWIYVGPHNDAGWSQAHDQGRLYVQKMLGSKVKTTFKENIAVGAQLQQTVASLVNQGYKMIFGTSYGFFDKKLAASARAYSSSRRRAPTRPRTCPSTSGPQRTRSTSPVWPPERRRRRARSAMSSRTRSPR